MNLDIVWTNQFKKDYKLAQKRHLDVDLLDNIIRTLSRGEPLPEKNRDHALTAIGSAIANATSSQTGCSSTASKTMCSF